MMTPVRALGGALLLVLTLAPSAHAQRGSDERRVSEALDALHQAASDADFDRYFSLYANEAVFIGTDATERWTRDEFMAYTKVRFDTGTGWTYEMLERHISIAPSGQTAWFDERLDNAGLGETRGSGVLVMEEGRWKIAQYNLTIPIPNDLAREVAARIRALSGGS